MRYHTNTVNKDIHYFSCGNYVKDTRGTCEARYYIRADALEQLEIFELKRLAIMLQKDEALLADIQKTITAIFNCNVLKMQHPSDCETFAISSYCQACSKLSPQVIYACRAHYKRRTPQESAP